jgi:hypothetical protein
MLEENSSWLITEFATSNRADQFIGFHDRDLFVLLENLSTFCSLLVIFVFLVTLK